MPPVNDGQKEGRVTLSMSRVIACTQSRINLCQLVRNFSIHQLNLLTFGLSFEGMLGLKKKFLFVPKKRVVNLPFRFHQDFELLFFNVYEGARPDSKTCNFGDFRHY